MSQPILTLGAARAGPTTAAQASLNLLPCRIHHDGSVDSAAQHWCPRTEKSKDDNDNTNANPTDTPTKTAYLRGRKLHGKTVPLPAGYYGAVVEKGETRREVPRADELPPIDDMNGDVDMPLEEEEAIIEVAPVKEKARFDSIVVWGHEATADAGQDPYVRSMEEWVAFAETIHSYPS